MLLAAHLLKNVCSVNDYDQSDAIETTQGDPMTLFLRLVDLSQDRFNKPVGRRYVPASGSTLTVVFKNLDDARQVTRVATQTFPTSDPSIWEVPILAADALVGTIDIGLSLLEGDVTITGGVKAAILAYPANTSYSLF